MFEMRWEAHGPRITFSFTACPLCRQTMKHPTLEKLQAEVDELRAEVAKRAMMRLRYDNLLDHAEITTPSSPFYEKPEAYAMQRFVRAAPAHSTLSIRYLCRTDTRAPRIICSCFVFSCFLQL